MTLRLSLLISALALSLASPALADVGPIGECTDQPLCTDGSKPCNGTGTCGPQKCNKGGMTYLVCMGGSAGGASAAGGSAGASATAGSAPAPSGGGSSDDSGCSVSSTTRNGATAGLMLAAGALLLLSGRRRSSR